jgi:protein ImuA
MPATTDRIRTQTALLRRRARQDGSLRESGLEDSGLQNSGLQDSGLHDRSMSADRDRQPTLAEVFAETAVDGAATAFALAHLDPGKPLLWVQDRLSQRECGRPFPPGFAAPLPLIHVSVGKAADVLWTMEEALGCPALGGVLGEVWGDPAVLDFTATKRLALRAEAHGVAAWLIRRAAAPSLSAARLRWRIASLPATADPHDLRAPGTPVWRAELFRARWRKPGQWVARPEAGRLVMEHGVDLPEPADRAARQQA